MTCSRSSFSTTTDVGVGDGHTALVGTDIGSITRWIGVQVGGYVDEGLGLVLPVREEPNPKAPQRQTHISSNPPAPRAIGLLSVAIFFRPISLYSLRARHTAHHLRLDPCTTCRHGRI